MKTASQARNFLVAAPQSMEKQSSGVKNGGKVKLLVSYGGKILSRPTDRQLSYVGGDTKILAVDRRARFREMAAKLKSLANRNENSEICVKYQLPGEDLDALVSLIDDEDVKHMMVEYDRMQRISAKPARLRLFIFDVHAPPLKSDRAVNPDYLFGFDKEYRPSVGPALDLLQIPSVDLSQNHVYAQNHSLSIGSGKETVAAVANGGLRQKGKFPYGLVSEIGKMATGNYR